MMDGKFLETLVAEVKPDFVERDGELYSNKIMYHVHDDEPMACHLALSSLNGLLDYIKSRVDFTEHIEPMLIHIESPRCVRLLSKLNNDRNRECLAIAKPDIPTFEFGQFQDAEHFTIKLMSMFNDYQTEDGENDKNTILKYIGTAQTGTLQAYGDDGVSQSVTIQKTTTSKEAAIVPNPVYLFPYRTFLEVEQPGSPFIFRMKDDNAGIRAALFEADGGMWKIEAVENIKIYLENALSSFGEEFSKHFIVIG